MDKAHKIAVVTITYNTPKLLPVQIEAIRKFCSDDFEIIVIDNSTLTGAIEAIRYYCEQLGVERIKTSASSSNGSDSHSFAANLSYLMLRQRFTHFFYLDHDCFPVKPFSVIETLGDNIFAGIAQEKTKTYLWPGCFMFNNSLIADNVIDFSPSHEFGLDTGGNLYKALELYPGMALFLDEVYEQNAGFNKSMYSFYSIIGGLFMHFINASNWSDTNDHEERINSLLNILKEKTDA